MPRICRLFLRQYGNLNRGLTMYEEIMGDLGEIGMRHISTFAQLTEEQTINLLGHLIPAVTQRIKSNVASVDGLSMLISELESGRYAQYLDMPEQLGKPAYLENGKVILCHISGSEVASDKFADQLADAAELDRHTVRKTLPLATMLVMACLNKKAHRMGLLDMLGCLLDYDYKADLTDDKGSPVWL